AEIAVAVCGLARVPRGYPPLEGRADMPVAEPAQVRDAAGQIDPVRIHGEGNLVRGRLGMRGKQAQGGEFAGEELLLGGAPAPLREISHVQLRVAAGPAGPKPGWTARRQHQSAQECLRELHDEPSLYFLRDEQAQREVRGGLAVQQLELV